MVVGNEFVAAALVFKQPDRAMKESVNDNSKSLELLVQEQSCFKKEVT